MRSALPTAALALTVVALLTGCVPHDPEVAPPPEPTTEPVFATDEEALEAATDAYKAYLEMSDLIAQEGGKDPERIAPYVTDEVFDGEVESFESLATRQIRQTGDSHFDTVSLQQLSQDADSVFLSLYLCLDLVDAELVDNDGKLITPIEQKRWPFEALFERSHDSDSRLKLTGHVPWTGTDFCS